MRGTGAVAEINRTLKSAMSKPIQAIQAMAFCGIDVSAATLAVAVQQQDQRFEERIFDNTASGTRP